MHDARSYDELPYADYAFPRSHPEHLQAVSLLCGRAAPSFARARVLELGCARGGNLLPMAVDLPDGDFVGVDLSARHIAEAEARVLRFGMRNVTLVHGSLDALDEALGDFDYIVCHGVYSWVPPAVRAAILRVCRARLRPDGVAYVSFNALPGWNALRTLRDFLRMHVPEGAAPARVGAARRALAVYDEALRAGGGAYAAWMRAELAALAEADDSYVFHELLEAHNEPVYLKDFVDAARAQGMAYLADADLSVAAPALRGGATDPVALAQSVDFAVNRRFHAALLVRDTGVAWRVDVASIARMHLATRAELAADCEETTLRGERPFVFTVDGVAREVRDVWLGALLATLAVEERRPVPYAIACARVAAMLRLDATSARTLAAKRAADVLELLWEGVVTPHLGGARYEAEASLRPWSSPYARAQAVMGTAVTTFRHAQVDVAAFERSVLALLDGTRDRSALVAELGATAGRCEEALAWLARNALLAERDGKTT